MTTIASINQKVVEALIAKNKVIQVDSVGYFLESYVIEGGVATKNATKNNQIDVTKIYVNINQVVTTYAATDFTTSATSATYYLDFTKDGEYSWGTSHASGVSGTDYTAVAEVTTDADGNVNVITDKRGNVNEFRLKSGFTYPEVEDLAGTGRTTETVKGNKDSIDALKADNAQRMVNVKQGPYSAKGDGVTDDTAAIQQALDSGYDVFIPGGTFLIDAELGLVLASNTTITMSPDTTLKVKTNAATNYMVFDLTGVSNIRIFGNGATLLGDLDSHTGTTGEWGYGVSIGNSQNVYVDNLQIKKMWGDGVNLDSADGSQANVNKNITLKNIICDDNRRQGMSISGVEDMLIENCQFINTGVTKTTAPSAGIDFEPSYETIFNKRITLRNCTIKGNVGVQIDFHSRTDTVRFYDCLVEGVENTALWMNELTGSNAFENCAFYGETLHLKNATFRGCYFYTDASYFGNFEYALEADTDDPLIVIDCKIVVTGLRKFMFLSGVTGEKNRRKFINTEFVYDGNAYGDFTEFVAWNDYALFERCKFYHTGADPAEGVRYIIGSANANGETVILDDTYIDPIFSTFYGLSGLVTIKKASRQGEGVATITSGSTSVTVNHGLTITPTVVTVTAKGNVGASWVSAIDGTNFTINIPSAAGADTAISWRAS